MDDDIVIMVAIAPRPLRPDMASGLKEMSDFRCASCVPSPVIFFREEGPPCLQD